MKPIVGDEVRLQPEGDDTGVLTAIEPRRSELARIDSRGKPEIVAVNVTQLIVTLATDPSPDWFLVDRYLAAAELGEFRVVLVYNKIDLAASPPTELGEYAALGYTALLTSTREPATLEPLAAAMGNRRSVLIGQSGVGKSSLINALLGDVLQSVGDLSEKSGQGRHTTTTSVLYPCPQGGDLIDSPGVRDFAPFIADPRSVVCGFREIAPKAEDCRFPDCSHRVEPDCAVKAAVEQGAISARRYESYRRLYELTETMTAGQY